MVLWYIVYFVLIILRVALIGGAAFTVFSTNWSELWGETNGGKIPNEVIDEIRSQTNIVDVVGQHCSTQESRQELIWCLSFSWWEDTIKLPWVKRTDFSLLFLRSRGERLQVLDGIEQIKLPEALTKVADFAEWHWRIVISQLLFIANQAKLRSLS